MKTVADIIESFTKRGSKEALVYKTGYRTFRLTYKELYKKVIQTAAFLEQLDIKKGDKVILWAFNSPSWSIVFLACAYKGVVVVPIDAKAMPEFVEKIHGAVHAKAIFHAAYKLPPKLNTKLLVIDYLDKYISPPSLRGGTTKQSSTRTENEGDRHAHPSLAMTSTVTEDDLLEIVYTSGTTGDPKGVMLTQKNLVANINSVLTVVSIKSDQTFLSVLPLTHLFEQNPGFLAPLSLGCTVIYMLGIRPSLIFKTLHDERITNIILVPRLLKLFADGIKREFENKGLTKVFNFMLNVNAPSSVKKMLFLPVHKKFGTHFQFFVSGGAPLTQELDDFWTKMGFTVLQGYGLTECSPVLTVNATEGKRAGSVGFALPGITLKTNKDDELYAKGDNITKGYYQKEKETKALFDDGWMRTGDIGTIDEDGYLFLKGRQKDMIVTAAGVNVYPEDIEQKLLQHPELKDVCVLGLPTENGEEVHAEIILKSPSVIPSAAEGSHTTKLEKHDSGSRSLHVGRDDKLRKLVATVNQELNESQQITSYAEWEKDDFPRTTTMKIQKRFVLTELQNRKQKKAVAAATNLPKLYTMIARINSIDPALVKPQATLSLDLKLTSINRVELVSLIEQELNVDIDEEEITAETTVGDVEKMVNERKRLDDRSIFHPWLLSPIMRVIRIIYNVLFMDNIIRLYCRRTVNGLENLKDIQQPVIFISNHTSYFDAPNILMSLPTNIRMNIAAAAYKEYFDIPKEQIMKMLLYKFYYYHASLFTNIYLFPRVKGFKKSLEYTGELLDKNWNILFFPEGKHSPDGKLQQFQTGIGWLIKEMRVSVVPIKLEGMDKVLHGDVDDKITLPKSGKVSITFGKPVTPDYTKSILEITKDLQDLITKM